MRAWYCPFRTEPRSDPRLYMTPEEVIEVARTGERLGCTEALFTLGKRPGQRLPEARERLRRRAGIGACSRPCARSPASIGLMLENTSGRLCRPGGPHAHAPSKGPNGVTYSLTNRFAAR